MISRSQRRLRGNNQCSSVRQNLVFNHPSIHPDLIRLRTLWLHYVTLFLLFFLWCMSTGLYLGLWFLLK